MEAVSYLPYRVEYFGGHYGNFEGEAWRAGCRGCKRGFPQGQLRIAAKVQSYRRDEKELMWYHFDCFFLLQRPHGIEYIENFEAIRYNDQQKIRKKLDEIHQDLVSESSTSSQKSKKSKSGNKRPAVPKIVLNDFGVEYSKSGRAECVGCRSKIMKDVIRVKKLVYHTEVGMKFGGQPFQHHLDCFAQIRVTEYGFYLSGEKLPGFKSLTKKDQEAVLKALPEIHADKSAVKKKKKTEENKESSSLEEKIAQQTKEYFAIRDNLKKIATTKMLQELLKVNGSGTMPGFEKMLDRCADFIAFGAIEKCTQCKTGDLVFEKHGYRCNGKLNEWAECKFFQAAPKRFKCKLTETLRKSNKENKFEDFLAAMTVRDRAVRPYTEQKPISNPFDIKVERQREPLYNMHIVPVGLPTKERPALKRRIESMGGKLVTTLQPMIAVVISTPELVERMNKRMQEVEKLNIQVVEESFLDAIAGGSPQDTIQSIKELAISDWGSDPLSRIPQEETRGQRESLYTRGAPKVANMKLKNGIAIDPDSGLSDRAHVYQRNGVLYTTVLNYVDIQANKNSYYKIQVLQSDDMRSFWIFNSWGRTGTKIGDSHCEQSYSAESAVCEFESIYQQKTGNKFGSKFVKKPGKFYPVDIDYEDDSKKFQFEKSDIPSKLPEKIQNLVKMLFDVNLMNQMMVEFKLDLEKMPLGRLSKKQLNEANETLKDLSDLITSGAPQIQFVAMSNKFYTLVPHNFGMRQAPIIDTLEAIKEKSDMIESLLDIEIAYSMLQEDVDEKVNPVDCRYAQLKTNIEVLEEDSKEFKMIEKYVKNTHAATHDHFKLVVDEVFKIKREGEKDRYKPFKTLHNRQLLWHGSRLTNYVGILKNGLRIAPPEAPMTGYMFGKGVYFADSVSKSANYCFTTPENNTGFMLLSEVALGDTYDLGAAKPITKLPEGKHSTKGFGQTYPDPKMEIKINRGVTVPLGKLVKDEGIQSVLQYNEYIVYDVAQINIKYLLKMKFDYGK